MEEFFDDLKSNFRPWEQDCDNIEDAKQLTSIMINRHPEEDPNIIKDWCWYWVGASMDEEV